MSNPSPELTPQQGFDQPSPGYYLSPAQPEPVPTQQSGSYPAAGQKVAWQQQNYFDPYPPQQQSYAEQSQYYPQQYAATPAQSAPNLTPPNTQNPSSKAENPALGWVSVGIAGLGALVTLGLNIYLLVWGGSLANAGYEPFDDASYALSMVVISLILFVGGGAALVASTVLAITAMVLRRGVWQGLAALVLNLITGIACTVMYLIIWLA